jgi:hypothetical protein
MRQCGANKRDGAPCTLPAQGESGLCWPHDPANAEKRRRGQSRGGRSKPVSDLSMLKQKLVDLGDAVMSGEAIRGDTAVATTCYGTAIKAIEALVKVRELEESRLVETGLKLEEQRELTKRLEELEDLLAEKNGRRGWGA